MASTLELLETCWRMKGPSGKVFQCGILPPPPRQGSRCAAGYGEADLMRSERVKDLTRARQLAEQWRQVILAKGGFVDLCVKRDTTASADDREGA
jgi:hypothetical protein